MKLLLTLFLAITLNLPFAVLGRNRRMEKETLIGTVVARYSFLTCVYHPCAAWLIVRLRDTHGTQPTYVRVVVEYFPEMDRPNKGFPEELLKIAQEWKFKATRSQEGDQPLERFLKVEDIESHQDISEKTAAPAWVLLPGAEDESLPFGSVLRCYQVDTNRYERHSRKD